MNTTKIKEYIMKLVKNVWEFVVNPRLWLCFGLGWMITNGWSYIMLVLGTYYGIEWMMVVAGAYMSFLWFPFTPEKAVTLVIAIALLRFLFPNDKRSLQKLKDLQAALKRETARKKEKREQKKLEKQQKKEQRRE